MAAMWYVGSGRSERVYYEVKRELFGNNASYYPRLYFEVGIPILVERLHLPQSQYFKDIDYST